MTIVANRLTALIKHNVNQCVQINTHVFQTRIQNLCTIFSERQGRILLHKSLPNHAKTTLPNEEIHSLTKVSIYERLILNSKGHPLNLSLSFCSPWWRQPINRNVIKSLMRTYFSNQGTLLKSFDRKQLCQTTITRNSCKKSKCGKVAKKKKSGCPKKKKCKAKKPSFPCKKRIPCIKKMKKKKGKKRKKRKKGKKSKCKPKSSCKKRKPKKKKKKVKDCKKVVKRKPPVTCKKKSKKAATCKKKKKPPCGEKKKKCGAKKKTCGAKKKKCAPKKKKCGPKKKKCGAKKKKCAPKKKKCGAKKKKCAPKKKKCGPKKKKCGPKKKKCGSKTKCSAAGGASTSKEASNPACGGKCIQGNEPDLVCKRANSGVSQAPPKKVRICSKRSNKYPKSRGYCFPRN